MALAIFATNNRDYNPFSVLTNAEFQHIIDQGFSVTWPSPRPSLITDDFYYADSYDTPNGVVTVIITDLGIYAYTLDDTSSDEPDEQSWLFASLTFETAWNNMHAYVMSKKNPPA